MTIKEIFLNEEISVRAFNTCKNNKIETISELKEFYRTYGSFKPFRNCGSKTNSELVKIYFKYFDYVDCNREEIKINSSSSIVELLNKLDKKQIVLINNFISIHTQQLSARNSNAIYNLLNNDLEINSLAFNFFLKEKYHLNNIPNIGKISIPEIINYLDKIKSYIVRISEIYDDNEFYFLEFEYVILNRFGINSIPNNLQCPFKLLNYLIIENIFLNKLDTLIMINTLEVYNTENLNSKTKSEYLIDDNIMDDFPSDIKIDHPIFKNKENAKLINLLLKDKDNLTKKLNLSRERIRQKQHQIFNLTIEKLDFLRFLKNFEAEQYKIETNNDIVFISDEISDFINKKNDTYFTKHFILLIISNILKDDFNIVGDVQDILFNKKYRKSYNWNCLYLIRKQLINYYDFNSFISDVSFRMNEKIEEDYKFNFKSYVSRFYKEDIVNLNNVVSVCEKLINFELNINLTLNDEILFEKNSVKTVSEYAYEALEDLNAPSHVDDICKHVKVLYPAFDNRITSSNLKREFGFVPFGRSSVFGLKKWELEDNTIKSGTIRSIAEEFLLKYDKPMHKSEIAKYVLEYRPESNERSIIFNLKMEDHNRFLFFKKSLIGLKSKKYYDYGLELSDDNDKIDKKTWDESYQVLINFIKKHNRLPSTRSCPLDEIIISRWLNVQRSKKNRGILEEDKIDKINEVVFNYNLIADKIKLSRIENYKKLAQFILKEKRLPSANKTDERRLYAFFYQQRKLFEQGTLDLEEKSNFIDITKLIQNI
jgi:hypothetical protein